MTIQIDKNGFPQVTNLAVFSPVAEGRPGNDFHNAATGQFTFAIPGVTILRGSPLLKQLSATTRKLIGTRAKVGLANQLSMAVIDGNLHVVLLRNGKKIDSFMVLPKAQRNVQGDEKKDAIISPGQMEGPVRDALLDAARDLNLEGEALFAFLEERLGRPLDDSEKRNLEAEVRKRRIDDLVSYLNQELSRKIENSKKADTIRIAVGRGYVRKSFAFLTKNEANEVISRLAGLGWTEAQIQEKILDGLGGKYKDMLNVVHKEEKPDA